LLNHLKNVDPEVYSAISKEFKRQEEHLEMIASENYTSQAVMEAQGSVLTNKYAEGLPHKRYYGGCEYVDIVEDLAIERLKKLFGAEHATFSHTLAHRQTKLCFSLSSNRATQFLE
jgi:glycine hydroxymethyltransferase